MALQHKSRPIYALRVAGVALLALILLIAGFELAVRVVMPDVVTNWRAKTFGGGRVIFISKGAFENAVGYFKYSANERIRELAYYPDEQGRLTVEYDCAYDSDELGFLSNSINYRDAEILVLGDSFTQGQGGCAWNSRLAPETRSRMYSAAVMGQGIRHWRNILADLEQIKKPKKILIIFITTDMKRDDWVFGERKLSCLSGRKECRNEYWQPISDRMDELAAKRYALRSSGNIDMGKSTFLKYHLAATYSLIAKLKAQQSAEDEYKRYSEAIEIVSDIAGKYPLKMIWVNRKEEVEEPSQETIRIWQKLKGIDVTRCNIPPEGFLPRDGHPNASGYEVLKNCVENVVRSW